MNESMLRRRTATPESAPRRLRRRLAWPWLVPALLCSLALFAEEHVWYLDSDHDSFGDPAAEYPLPQDWTPTPLLTARAGDPDDGNPWVFPWPVPQGERRAGLPLVSGAQSGGWPAALYQELGVDAVTQRIPWTALESAPGVYAGPDAAILTALAATLPSTGLGLSLTLSTIERTRLVLPDDLRVQVEAGELRMHDDAVVARYTALLDHVHATLGSTVELVGLQLAYEFDRRFPLQPDLQFWIDFQVFCFRVTQHAKALWGAELPVGVTATHDGLTSMPQQALVQYVASSADVVSMTLLPASHDFTVVDPARLDLAALIAQVLEAHPGKPLHIEAAGYPSAATVGGSELRQSQFLYELFEVWDAQATRIPFIAFAALHDETPQGAEAAVALDAMQPAAAAADFHASLGVRRRDGEGSHKTAYNTLRNELFERGWWTAPPAASRPYRVGFTPKLYDFPDDPGEVLAVEQFVFEKMANEGDFTNIHMDGGIPWPEAYADDFQSPTPPYSANLLETWRAMRERRPPDNALLVSINPLGIPRRHLAPYWGVGEEFSYQQEPPWGRVPLGVVSDGAPRIPPPPWDGYDFYDAPVRQAFINYARRAVEFFDPDYLLIGIEVSATQVEDEAAWQGFLDLHKAVYAALKARYPELPVMVSVSATSYMTDEFWPLVDDPAAATGHTWKDDEMAPGVRERLRQGLSDILPYTDILGLSHYPHFGKYNAYQMPASMWDQLFVLLDELGAGDKPLAVTESGYSADPFYIALSDAWYPELFTGSPEKQARHLDLMFYELRNSGHPVAFIANFAVRDGDLWHQRLTEQSDDVFNQFYQYFRDIGIYDGAGGDRSGTLRWRREAALPYVPAE